MDAESQDEKAVMLPRKVLRRVQNEGESTQGDLQSRSLLRLCHIYLQSNRVLFIEALPLHQSLFLYRVQIRDHPLINHVGALVDLDMTLKKKLY